MESLSSKKIRAMSIMDKLGTLYDAVCTLEYASAFNLLISTILSAQCTDVRVNMVTPALFEKYPTPLDLSQADINELMDIIRSTGFYSTKAKNIINCCKRLVDTFEGTVPDNMEDLLTLDGVGRKTASVVLGEVFHKPAIVIDTHAGRLSRRMGFTKNTDPVKVENDLAKILPKENSFKFCHLLVHHGRKYCSSRKPLCADCPINKLCPKIL